MAQQTTRGSRHAELFSISETLKLLLSDRYDSIEELQSEIKAIVRHIEESNIPITVKSKAERLKRHS